MTRYILRPRTYHRFKTRGYSLICKICKTPILPMDEVESKTGRSKGGPKLYHASCYDDYHLEFESDEDDN